MALRRIFLVGPLLKASDDPPAALAAGIGVRFRHGPHDFELRSGRLAGPGEELGGRQPGLRVHLRAEQASPYLKSLFLGTAPLPDTPPAEGWALAELFCGRRGSGYRSAAGSREAAAPPSTAGPGHGHGPPPAYCRDPARLGADLALTGILAGPNRHLLLLDLVGAVFDIDRCFCDILLCGAERLQLLVAVPPRAAALAPDGVNVIGLGFLAPGRG